MKWLQITAQFFTLAALIYVYYRSTKLVKVILSLMEKNKLLADQVEQLENEKKFE